jgi:hypothetical protein
MSHYPFDRSFHPEMSKCLLRLATDFRMDNRIVPWDELLGSDTILNELAHALRRSGWPERTYEEVRKELLRLHGRWKKVVQTKSETFLRIAAEHTFLWTDDGEDEDDIFMPSTKAKSTAPSKGKSTASSQGKSAASTKGKSTASSKGKSAASAEDDDDAFM